MTEAAPDDPRVRAAAAAAGDRDAAESLLTELAPRARNLIRYLVRGDADVDDIAQEALLALLRGFGSYKGTGKLSSWSDRVVVRVAFTHLSRERRDRSRRAEVPDLSLIPDDGDAPDEYAARRELVALLDQLPDDQRHVLVLHYVLGMTVPEVAERLTIPFETVRSRLRRGRDALRHLKNHRAPVWGNTA